MQPEGLIAIGRLTKPHGLRGDVVFLPYVYDLELLPELVQRQGTRGPGVKDASRRYHQVVFVVEDGKARAKLVETGISDDNRVEIKHGLAEGEMVLAGPPAEWVGTIAEGLERRRVVGASLTEREREVLDVAAEGFTAREIAERLGVRERTITTHLSRIYAKLGVGGRFGAIREATRSGLIVQGSAE